MICEIFGMSVLDTLAYIQVGFIYKLQKLISLSYRSYKGKIN